MKIGDIIEINVWRGLFKKPFKYEVINKKTKNFTSARLFIEEEVAFVYSEFLKSKLKTGGKK